MGRAFLPLFIVALFGGVIHGMRLDSADERQEGKPSLKPSVAVVSDANNQMESLQDILHLLAEQGCQDSVKTLSNDVTVALQGSKKGRAMVDGIEWGNQSLAEIESNELDDELDELVELNGKPSATLRRTSTQTKAIADTATAWQEGAGGQACRRFEDALLAKVAGSNGVSSLAESGTDASFGNAGLIIDIGLQATVLGGQAGGTIGIVVLGKRAGTITRTLSLGVETTILGAGVKIGFTALRELGNLNQNGCGLSGKLSVPGLPLKLFSVGCEIMFKSGSFAGIGVDASVGPSLDLGLPIGVQFTCSKTKELRSK